MTTTSWPFLLSILACTLLVLPVKAGEEAKNPAEKGTVIFYRTQSAKGGAIRLRITDGDNADVGHLTNGSKIVKELDALKQATRENLPRIR